MRICGIGEFARYKSPYDDDDDDDGDDYYYY